MHFPSWPPAGFAHRHAVFVSLVFLACTAHSLLAQSAPSMPGDSESMKAEASNAPLRLYLDCGRCDVTYMRSEITFVNHVRIAADAQVHALITDQPTGGGGRAYTLSLTGLGRLNGRNYEYRYVARPGQTDDDVRQGLARVLKAGLLPYLVGTPLFSNLTIGYDQQAPVPEPVAQSDPWNRWVFRVSTGGWFDYESNRRRFSLGGSFSANRVTEMWRLRSRIEFDFDSDWIRQGETTIRSEVQEWDTGASLVRSISNHWSVGFFSGFDVDPSRNMASSMRLAPAVEYNIYPYSEVTRREFTIAYSVGGEAIAYDEVTLFGYTEQQLVRQSLDLNLRVKQRWGSVRAGFEAANYFYDLSRYSLEFFGNVSVRLFKGLSMQLSTNLERVRDQIYLPAGDASLEEVLLQRRRLATGYDLSGSLGLTYTFGSIYNDVINMRL